MGVPGGGWGFPLIGTTAGGGPRPCCGGLVGVAAAGGGSLLVTPSTPLVSGMSVIKDGRMASVLSGMAVACEGGAAAAMRSVFSSAAES